MNLIGVTPNRPFYSAAQRWTLTASWASRRRSQVFAGAVDELFGCMTRLEHVVPRESRRLELRAIDEEALLEEWLAELIAICRQELTLFCRAEAELADLENGDLRLSGKLFGEPFDPLRHHLRGGVQRISDSQWIRRADGFGARMTVVMGAWEPAYRQ